MKKIIFETLLGTVLFTLAFNITSFFERDVNHDDFYWVLAGSFVVSAATALLRHVNRN